MTHIISVEGIECYARHGCLEEETLIGGLFSVDVHLEADLSEAIQSDNLSDTIDYVIVNKIVTEQMAIPSRLIEHVAGRIFRELKSAFAGVETITLKINKFNPPVNGNVRCTSFIMTERFR